MGCCQSEHFKANEISCEIDNLEKNDSPRIGTNHKIASPKINDLQETGVQNNEKNIDVNNSNGKNSVKTGKSNKSNRDNPKYNYPEIEKVDNNIKAKNSKRKLGVKQNDYHQFVSLDMRKDLDTTHNGGRELSKTNSKIAQIDFSRIKNNLIDDYDNFKENIEKALRSPKLKKKKPSAEKESLEKSFSLDELNKLDKRNSELEQTLNIVNEKLEIDSPEKNKDFIQIDDKVEVSNLYPLAKNSEDSIQHREINDKIEIIQSAGLEEIKSESEHKKKKKVKMNSLFNPNNKNAKFSPDLFITLKDVSIVQHYSIGKEIGEDLKRAMKTVKKKSLLKEDEKKLLSEITILKKLDHPNIIKLFDLFQNEESYFLITEYLNGGDLFDRIKKLRYFNEGIAAQYMRQILSGLLYLHQKRVCHRDLKPENILFDSPQDNSALKIIDFGTSRRFDSKKPMTKRIGTPYYIAPEVLKKSYNEKCDIWSCGIILYVMLCGYPPYMGKSEADILKKIAGGKLMFPEKDWLSISKDAKNLIKKMLCYDDKQRLSAKEALNDYWIQKNISTQPLCSNILTNLSNFSV